MLIASLREGFDPVVDKDTSHPLFYILEIMYKMAVNWYLYPFLSCNISETKHVIKNLKTDIIDNKPN